MDMENTFAKKFKKRWEVQFRIGYQEENGGVRSRLWSHFWTRYEKRISLMDVIL